MPFRMFKSFAGAGLVLLMSLGGIRIQAQGGDLLRAEGELAALLDSIVKESEAVKRGDWNNAFSALLQKTLRQDGAFDYPFDSLANVGKQTAADGRVRIFTWNIPQPGGGQQYFGLLMHRVADSCSVFALTDGRRDYQEPHLEVGDAGRWYGALYYDMVEVEHEGVTCYTLLGVDLNDLFSSKRVIEALSFDRMGTPTFGAPIFRLGSKLLNRVILEYTSRATMVLRWDKTSKLIVSSHLVPMQPSSTGNFRYYVPDLSYDGFQYTGSCWEFTPDIDIRNPSRKRTPLPQTPEEENFDPGFLYKSGRHLRNQ